jgi:F-type H+-transporting ATPase subunit delta
MQGESRQALQGLLTSVRALDGVHLGDLGAELLAVSALVGREATLRNALTDTGVPGEARGALARRVLGDRVGAATQDVVADAASRRWSSPRDLTEALETLGAEATFAGVEADGRIDTVEEELFRVSRLVEGSAPLQSLLTDPSVADTTKADVVTDLLAGRAQPETSALVRHAVQHAAGRRLTDVLDELVAAAAERREQLLADVRTPVAMTPDQQTALAAALTRIYGRPVTVAATVDPELLGGAVVRVGDEIIDGSVATRLADLRRRLTQ